MMALSLYQSLDSVSKLAPLVNSLLHKAIRLERAGVVGVVSDSI